MEESCTGREKEEEKNMERDKRNSDGGGKGKAKLGRKRYSQKIEDEKARRAQLTSKNGKGSPPISKESKQDPKRSNCGEKKS